MTPLSVMVVAGDPSGDLNAADLVTALAASIPGAKFFGAGGPKMAEAGVELAFNLTDDAAIGPVDIVRKLGSYRQRCHHLAQLASQRQPGLIILVDFYTFNQRLARAIKKQAPPDWKPKIVRSTSPQVWASRPGRADELAKNVDLLLCLYPFEKESYLQRGTSMRVEFVGHPLIDRHSATAQTDRTPAKIPTVVLLPGSRTDEVERHLPIMLAAAQEIAAHRPVRIKLVAANERLAAYIRSFQLSMIELQVGRVADALFSATLAIAKTGTITMECAYFGVPTLAIYKTSPLFYFMARPLVTVKYLAMPNILANEAVFPEFIQEQATPEKLAHAALELLSDGHRRSEIRAKLRRIIESMGGPGSAQRSAGSILQLFEKP